VLGCGVGAGCAASDDTEPAGGEVAQGEPSPAGLPPGDVLSGEDAVAQGETTQTEGGPLIERQGSSTATVMPVTSQGEGLAIHGGNEQGAYLLASYSTPTSGGDATARFTVAPRGDAAFVYTLRGTGSGYSSRQLRLERAPGSNTLDASATGGVVTCGTVASDGPTAVALVYHAATQTFDVQIGGAATPCTGLKTKMAAPVVGFRLMDASNEGYGGEVTFTGLSVQ